MCGRPSSAAGSGVPLALRLLSHRQRFAARLWPAAALLSRHLDAQPELVRGKHVLELGAGAALPSLYASLLGASAVLVTDWPDERMLENTRFNLAANLPPPLACRASVCGYNWARPARNLLSELGRLRRGGAAAAEADQAAGPAAAAAAAEAERDCFDVVLMSDLLYECEHEALLSAAAICLGGAAGGAASGVARAPGGRVLLTFQPHDPIQLARQLRCHARPAPTRLQPISRARPSARRPWRRPTA